MSQGLLYIAQRAKVLSRLIRRNPVGRRIWCKDLQARLIEVIQTASRLSEAEDDPLTLGRLKQFLGEVQQRMLSLDLKSAHERAFGSHLMGTLAAELNVQPREPGARAINRTKRSE